MGSAAALALVVLCACSRPASSTPEQRLAAYLESGGRIERLEGNDFDRIIVDPFRSLYADYAAQPMPVVAGHDVRRHFAGDPALSPSQVRLRWMVPVMYPAYVAGGAVFVEVRGGWRTLTGLDEAMLARVRSLDDACAGRLEMAGPPGSCTDVGWVIADAALRGDRQRFARACQLSVTVCGKR